MATVPDPMTLFARVYERARKSEPHDATAVCLATADAAGRPSARIVLLKRFDERGFVFFTNCGSRKARELAANPRAALCFYWPTIDEQVRATGSVEQIAPEESDSYFATRDRASQIGAWASRQSEALSSRARLVGRFLRIQARHPTGPVPRPPFWGGFRLTPEEVEFWRNQANRLHDRVVYTRSEEGWMRQRLYP